ncbi:MAG: WYL domain-containing protein [Chloroflexi bacterium]|nr:WYL domain-containing protein [Chloroflexota bacterium]
MRADRLITLLLLLQKHGRLTARELAGKLEVSERTIYRDVDALTTAGVPIYAEYRQGGGYALVENYRTTLTGLNDDEAAALFMLSVPAPLEALGQSEPLRRLLLKLSAALPDARHYDEERVRQRIYLDSTWWFQEEQPAPFLNVVQEAVWNDRQICIRYGLPMVGGVEIDQVVEPYGLVAKASVWYLVYGYKGATRVKRIAHLRGAQLLTSGFERPVGFDLEATWREWCAAIEDNHLPYRVRVQVAPHFLRELPDHLESSPDLQIGVVEPDGWVQLELRFSSFADARQRLLGCGRGVRILEPEPLRLSVLDFAAQIADLYSAGCSAD